MHWLAAARTVQVRAAHNGPSARTFQAMHLPAQALLKYPAYSLHSQSMNHDSQSQSQAQQVARAAHDEMRAVDSSVHAHYQSYADWLESMPRERLVQKRNEAETMFHRLGITFA